MHRPLLLLCCDSIELHCEEKISCQWHSDSVERWTSSQSEHPIFSPLLLCLKSFWLQNVGDLLLLILGSGGRPLLPPCRLPPCRHTCKVNIHSPLRLCWIMFFLIYSFDIFKNGVVGIWETVVFVSQLHLSGWSIVFWCFMFSLGSDIGFSMFTLRENLDGFLKEVEVGFVWY